MKRILLLLGILMLCVSVQGLSLTFQNPSDFTEFVTCTGNGVGSCSWVQSATGGNNYINVASPANSQYYVLRNLDPQVTDYAAATLISGTWNGGFGHGVVVLYDSSGAVLYKQSLGNTPVAYSKYEMEMVGGAAYIYKNGVEVAHSGALAQSPSYVGWGAESENVATSGNSQWDQFIYGSTENRHIFDSPESGYYLRYDMINPANSGFYNAAGTLISSNNMTTAWAKGSGTAETVNLMNWGDNVVVDSFSTGTAYAGTKPWSINDRIFNNPLAKPGYYVTTIPGSGEYSDPIPYISTGATITFNSATYSREDTATITYSIDSTCDGSTCYWDPAANSYRIDTLDAFFNVVDSQVVTTQAGSKTVDFTSSDPLGVYYAVLIAKPTGGNDIWMNLDTAELTGYLTLGGNVYDSWNETAIQGAVVNISQSSGIYNHMTGSAGNYSTFGTVLYSGSTTTINITKAGYRQYYVTKVFPEAKSIVLNFTLELLAPSHNGVAIYGVDRESITYGYGRPIAGATITATNTTYGESYSVTTNSVGGYQIDADDGVYLTPGRIYSLVASKLGYDNSVAYPVTAVGV